MSATLTPEAPVQPDQSPSPAPQTAPEPEAGGPSGAGGAPEAQPEPARPRRRRYALLLLLLCLVVVFGGIGSWYLATRKPISELPLPGITPPSIPHYVFSLYGVTRPTGVAVSATGDRIYVTDTDGARVVRIYDSKGNALGVIAPPDDASGDHVPVYVAVDPANGDVYVSDRMAGAIYIYTSDGTYRSTFSPPADLQGWQPLGLGFDTSGDLYVTDVSGPFHRVHEFAPDGSLVRTIGTAGQFNFPNGVAVDANGYLYVSDSNDGRLLVFDGTGTQVAVVGRGQKPGELGLPRGVAVDDKGVVYVADTSGYAVQLYHAVSATDLQPAYIGTFGTAGSLDGAFNFPNGVAVDSRARVYVTDSGNNRVQVWSY